MNFGEYLKKKPVILFDGAMGTEIAKQTKTSCNEELNLTAPEIVRSVHESFINAGSNVIETNTFGANRIVLAEHGLQDKVREINIAAVKIARQVCKFTSSQVNKLQKKNNLQTCKPANLQTVFISASIGPTSKLPSLGHISFDEMVSAYEEQASILLEAGVDLFQIETCQDILQAKAAVVACRQSFRPARPQASKASDIPIIVTVTIEKNGKTLTGSDVETAYTALAPLGISAFGLNCATGPLEMEPYIARLANISAIPIVVSPNAGIPKIKDGRAFYDLTPEEFAGSLADFVKNYGVRLIGGCCGTTPEHIKAVNRLAGYQVTKLQKKNNLRTCLPQAWSRGKRANLQTGFISSLYSTVNVVQEPRPLIVGERMNINGSKEFREHLLGDNFDAAALMAKKQADMGASLLDLSVAYAGRDEVSDMAEMAKRLNTLSILPIMIDSTNPVAVEVALKSLGGRCVVNSINLEDGGAKADTILNLTKKYGAAVVGLTIDKEGMALTCEGKVKIAKQLLRLCKDKTDILFIDPLTFTLADPKAAEFGSAKETLEAIGKIKKIGGRTILGVSNISFGLKPTARRVLNSLFLHEAVTRGLDAAIVHAGQLLPLHKIDKKALKLAKNLIFCTKKDALHDFIAHFDDITPKSAQFSKNFAKISDIKGTLTEAVIGGDKEGIKKLVGEAIKKKQPLDIINNILLPAMQKVGVMFGNGDLPLPFVLQSAEVMRHATDLLAPHLKKENVQAKGTIVLATVRGDIHDIGKDLVDIILSNNGYKVINLGVKQPAEAILKEAVEKSADAIGLSGLLVQSCLVMKDDLKILASRDVTIPVICGGAALTKKFVETELKKAYNGPVYYAKDAFDGLKIMALLAKQKK